MFVATWVGVGVLSKRVLSTPYSIKESTLGRISLRLSAGVAPKIVYPITNLCLRLIKLRSTSSILLSATSFSKAATEFSSAVPGGLGKSNISLCMVVMPPSGISKDTSKLLTNSFSIVFTVTFF